MLHVDPASAGSKSASSGSTVIGENTGVFIGGLPENFTLLRADSGKINIHQCTLYQFYFLPGLPCFHSLIKMNDMYFFTL